MPSKQHHLDQGAASLRASDTIMGEFAYHCAKVVRVNFLDAGTKELRPGALALAEKANISRDWVEDHAIAFRLLVELFQRGFSTEAKYYWRKLYKSHWITVAVDWRKHHDFEIALNDLETFDNMRMNPDEAKRSKDRDLSVGELLHRHAASTERQMEGLLQMADKNRHLLTKVNKLNKMLTEQYLPLVAEIIEANERYQDRQRRIVELGYDQRFERS